VAAESSCVDPFIRRIQAVLKETGSLRACLEHIDEYQARAKQIYRVDVYFIHALAVSTLSLTLLAIYEYVRYRGIPFPESRALIGKIMPAKNRSDEIILRKKNDDGLHAAMGQASNQETDSGGRGAELAARTPGRSSPRQLTRDRRGLWTRTQSN
jgi:hypothetical protein